MAPVPKYLAKADILAFRKHASTAYTNPRGVRDTAVVRAARRLMYLASFIPGYTTTFEADLPHTRLSPQFSQIPSLFSLLLTSQPMGTWREMTVSDVGGVLHVAEEVHPDLPEGSHVFTERVKLFPKGCLVLVDDDKLCGYAISHPIRHSQPPALDSLLGEIASDANQYYIHDLAILPKFRGKGHAAMCLDKLLGVARRYPTSCLVSVYGTTSFWGRFGFAAEPIDEVLKKKLENYGKNATYLSRNND